MTNTPSVAWRKSSHSHDSGECVEVAGFSSGAVGVRDSKDPDGPRLVLSRHAFRALLNGVLAQRR
ncbi:MAG TPA: DUF397 domain-containing protein [Streptosporangiaceae bacterium]|jgi:hypothetical protein|nr:DUF397 domain-containing protein [Streptosporangiaceae bacterium]